MVRSQRIAARRARAGFTLLESLITVGILALILGAFSTSLMRASGSARTGMSAGELQARTQRIVDRIAQELLAAENASFFPRPQAPASSGLLEYRRLEGFAGGAPQFGPLRRIARAVSPNDPVNGLDDDGNGVVDDGRVVWVDDVGQPDERTFVWTSWVAPLAAGEQASGADDNANGLIDEAGLSFSFQGDVLTIQLTLQRPDGEGRILTATATTSVTSRN